MIDKIINENKDILSSNNLEKINIGFTNLIYSVADKYIIKICKDKENEDNFNNEINFYLKNTNNKYIPKLYRYHRKENDDDFSYEIIEKLKGKSLYYLWHTYNEEERKQIIIEISNLMKSFHSIKGKTYDWGEYITNRILINFNKCLQLNLFSEQDKIKMFSIIDKMKMYLKSNDFRLVHSDIHFDNLVMCENKELKIIDFETAIYAPIDFELDIFLRMCNYPMKYASEETEKYVREEDYKNIERYLKEDYKELFEGIYYNERHCIYDLEAYLRLLPEFPKHTELKEIILKDIEIIENY